MPVKPHLLVICTNNRMRSATAEQIYRGDSRLDVRGAGTSPSAAHVVSTKDVEWADQILVMEEKHKEILQQRFANMALPPITVADIEDYYSYMDPELVEMLKSEIEAFI